MRAQVLAECGIGHVGDVVLSTGFFHDFGEFGVVEVGNLGKEVVLYLVIEASHVPT